MKKIRFNLDPKYKKYLPSKKFTYMILSFIGVCIFIFVISTLFFGKSSFLKHKKTTSVLTTQNLTLNQLLQRDSDGDGVMDWEEGLWGTDPNKTKTFDIPDSEYIKSKRQTAQMEGEIAATNGLTETDKFAQQFFASLAALKQSGQLDETTIKNLSTSLGQEMADSTLINAYTLQNIKIDPSDNKTTQESYYLNAGNLFEKYKEKGVGDELEIAGTLVASGTNTESENKLNTIANYYQEYAEKMLTISVPQSLSVYHLRIINSSNNTGIAVRNMAKISTDPVVGLSGVSQYQKYSGELIDTVGELETILSINGIIE